MAKRVFDLVLAAPALILAAPAILLIAGLIKLTSMGPVFYRGRRVGRFGKDFLLLKFRTMVVNAEQLGGSSTADGDSRITGVGKFLRKYKLDELPQLLNVIRGDMSLVGPRPEVRQYVDLYTEQEQQILSLRPGITDWASIWNSDEGAVLAQSDDPDRAYLELIRPTKLRLQLLYLGSQSLRTDLVILFYTLVKLAHRDWLPPELASYGRLVPSSGPKSLAA